MKLFLTFLTALCFTGLNGGEMQGFLTKEEIALFYSQGYLLKPKALDEMEVERLKTQVSAVIDRALDGVQNAVGPAISEEEQFLYIDGSRVVFKRRADQAFAIARINGCTGMEPELLKTIRSKKMVSTFFELLGTSDLEHIIAQIHPKLPGDQIAFSRHRDIQFRKSFDPDWQDILGNGSYAVCIIPIDPMTPENGGLYIDRNNYPVPKGQEEDLLWIHAEPGDLLFMHPYLSHGSGPNNSSTCSRKTLLTGFCAYGANHKAYPGTHINARVRCKEGEEIAISGAPWSQGPCSAPLSGH